MPGSHRPAPEHEVEKTGDQGVGRSRLADLPVGGSMIKIAPNTWLHEQDCRCPYCRSLFIAINRVENPKGWEEYQRAWNQWELSHPLERE